MYECFGRGKLPFGEPTMGAMEMANSILSHEPKPLSGVTERIFEVMRMAIQKDKLQRFSTADNMKGKVCDSPAAAAASGSEFAAGP